MIICNSCENQSTNGDACDRIKSYGDNFDFYRRKKIEIKVIKAEEWNWYKNEIGTEYIVKDFNKEVYTMKRRFMNIICKKIGI